MDNFFVWKGSPEIFSIPEFPLPFPIAVPSIIIAYLYWSYLESENEKKKKSKKRKGVTDEKKGLPNWGQALIVLIVSDIVLTIMDLWVFSSIGPIPIRWYGALFASSFFVGYQYASKSYLKLGMNMKQIDALLTYMIVAVVAGARLGHCLFYDPIYYLTNPLKILFVWEGGLASHGAAIGIVLAIYLFQKKNSQFSFWSIMDRLMVPIAIGASFIRLGNFFNSEIIGIATDVPWAIIFESKDLIPRHPTMLYESFSYLLCVILLIFIYNKFEKDPPEGLLFGIFLIYMFSARFIIEISKTEQAAFDSGLLSMGQWLSIPFLLFGFWVLFKIGLKNLNN